MLLSDIRGGGKVSEWTPILRNEDENDDECRRGGGAPMSLNARDSGIDDGDDDDDDEDDEFNLCIC